MQGLFAPLAKLPQIEGYEDAGAYLSYMRAKSDEPFEYYIGMLLPENTTAPEDYIHFDVPLGKIGVCWVQSFEPNI